MVFGTTWTVVMGKDPIFALWSSFHSGKSVPYFYSLLSLQFKAIKQGLIGTINEICKQEQGNVLSQGSLLTVPEAGPFKG